MKTVNSIMKRILTTGLAVVLLAGSAPANVYADSLTNPEMPVVISEGMEEGEESSNAVTTGSEVPETESVDEPEGQTIDEQETEVISDEVVVSEDTEDELTAEEVVSDPGEVFLEEEELSSYDAVQSVSPDGNLLSGSEGAYSDLIPTNTDNAEALAAKQVAFGGFKWYIIEDNSTGAREGTLTLFAAEFMGDPTVGVEYLNVFDKDYDDHTKTNKYSESFIKFRLVTWTLPEGASLHLLDDVRDAINNVTVETKGYNSDEIYDTVNAKLYLLDVATANDLPVNVRKCSAKALPDNTGKTWSWWLRSPGSSNRQAAFVDGSNGNVLADGQQVDNLLGVRPALQLDLSKVYFDSNTKLFSVDPIEDTYTGLIPTDSDDAGVLAYKQVTFGGIKWYIIEDNSSGGEEGSVTLFPVECIGNASVFKKWDEETKYSTSDVKKIVDAMTEEGGVLAGVACAINTVNLKTKVYNSNEVFDTVSNVKCYLLDIETAEKLPVNIRKCGEAPDSNPGGWWLRSPDIDVTRCTYVYCYSGEIPINQLNPYGNSKAGVRPALQLDLSAVNFNPGSKEFTLKPAYDVTLTGGANATASGGAKTQKVICGREMSPVTFTANEDCYFEEFDDISVNGITVTRNNKTTVTVSGTPSDNTSIAVPNAKVKQPAVVTLTPTAKTLKFTGKAQELVSAGEATGGTLQYALGNADGSTKPYTTSIPTGVNAGTYYVWYKVFGDEVHKDTAVVKVPVSIGKAIITAPGEIARTYPYNEESKDSVDLSTLVPEDAGTTTYQITGTDGDGLYKEAPSVSGNILSYTLNAGDSAKSGTITVKAQMQNYKDVTLTVKIEQIALGLYEKTGKTQYDPRPSKNLNQGKSFTLVTMFADGTVLNKRVVWSSTNPDVATVTQDGKVTGIGGGETVITARSEETPALSASCHVSVAEPVTGITLNRTGYSFGTGETVILTATVLPFTAIQPLRWESNNANVTIVPSTDGLSATITGAAAGKATVTAYATDDSGKKATCGFTVGSAVPAANEDGFSVTGKGNAENLAAGKTLAMNVNWPGNKKPANAEVIWSVVAATGETKEASRIATISQKGVLTGLSEGKIKVVATSVANSAIIKESAEITVYVPVKSVALKATSGTVSIKGKDGANGLQLQALVTSAIAGQTATGTALGSGPVVEWKVDPRYAHPEYLAVTPGGEVTANVTNAVNNIPVIGTVRAYNYEKTLTCKVSVKAENPLKGIKISSKKLSVGEGNTANLTAALDPVNPDGDNGYTWSSSDPSVVTVDETTGTVTALKPGTATITVTAKGKVVSKGKETCPSAACTVTVTPSVTGIVLKNANATNRLATGKTLSVKTEFVSSDENKKASTTLVWSSSDESIATVTQKGVIKAVSPGTVTITAQSADVKAVGPAPSKSFEVEVYAPVTKIAIDKSKLTIGTQNGSQYGKVSVSALLPVNVSDPSVEWKTNNELVELAAVDKGLAPSTGNFVNAKSNGVTVGGGQYLAVQAVSPGVVTLTGIAKDGSGKKVTCTVTVRGEVTGLSLKPLPPKNGLGQVEDKGEGKYESNLAPKGKLSLTPIVEINGITEATQKKTFADYKKYTDVSVSYRSSDTGVATVDKNGKITVNKDAQNEATATIYVTTADGRKTVELKITVKK